MFQNIFDNYQPQGSPGNIYTDNEVYIEAAFAIVSCLFFWFEKNQQIYRCLFQIGSPSTCISRSTKIDACRPLRGNLGAGC